MTEEFINPFIEDTRQYKTTDPCILVIFGATGDLTYRKLLPALLDIEKDGLFPSHFACVGVARREKSHAEFRKKLLDSAQKYSRYQPVDMNQFQAFSEQFFYHQSKFDDDAGYKNLHKFLQKLDSQFGTRGNRVYYLATEPTFFAPIIEKLKLNNLIYKANNKDKWSRVIIEKPFGHDYDSALELQKKISRSLDESQIYRIDHYLGKETVQNILIFRFSNPIFESVWNNRHIDHVQITVSEDIGIRSRGSYFEQTGLLRDIVQNHLMQLLTLVTMEPPTSFKADAIRDEKVKVLQSIRPLSMDDFGSACVRGQYDSGFINGKPVLGYRSETEVSPKSSIETFVAMEIFIDNWRFTGVPFYLRSGKRLPKRSTEISITFKDAPGFIFKEQHSKVDANILIIRIQPDEGISLKMNCKVPGIKSPIQPVKMDFHYSSYFGQEPPKAYERLIIDCMSGDSTLFARIDEVLTSWKFFTPLLSYWKETEPKNFPNYHAGQWGPIEADKLMERQGRKWRIL